MPNVRQGVKIQSIEIGGFNQQYQDASARRIHLHCVFSVRIIDDGVYAMGWCCSRIALLVSLTRYLTI
jgi:hypothetical protein